MENVNIPALPNPALTQILRSTEMRRLMQEKAEIAQALYRSIVAKPTGRLARSARIETHIGGMRSDRWVATMTVEAPYAASHEFGYGDKPGSTGRSHHVEAAAHDLNRVLNIMGAIG